MRQAGIWADALRRREPVIVNDYAAAPNKQGLPQGHSHLQRFISVPVLERDKVVMMLGVGNKPQDYGDMDVQTVRLFGEALWQLAQRERQMTQLLLQGAALAAAANTIVITDAGGNIEWVNDAFSKSTGYSREEAIGKNPRVLKSGRHDQAFYENLWRTISAGAVWRGFLHNKRKDGSEFEEEATITPLRNERGEITHYIAIKQDVTRQRELERQLLRAQRMETIGMLAGGVAHDLNNVMAPVSMGLELLKGSDLPRNLASVVDSMHASVWRGAGIVRQIMTFARDTGGERKPVDLGTIAKEIANMAKETFPKNIKIQCTVEPGLCSVLADASQMHQVLLNLVVNARDALPDGGRLTIEVVNKLVEELGVKDYPQAEPGEYVMARVLDDGTGMPPEVVDRIFEPFFTTKPIGRGSGLGLATVHGIVKSHQGFLTVDSTPRKGSLFCVYIPAHIDGGARPMEQPVQPPPQGRGETILLVDDEPSIRNVTKSLLEKSGYRVETAEDGADAMAVFSGKLGEIDLVLTDLVMPNMGGLALIKALRHIDPDIPIITASGMDKEPGQPDRRSQLEAQDVRRHLTKPFTAKLLLEELRNALDEG